MLIQGIVWYYGIKWIGLPVIVLDTLVIGLKAFTIVGAVWTGFRLIELVASVGSRRAAFTLTRFDDLVVPMVARTLKFAAVVIGIVAFAQVFGLPLGGLIGGLGLGGMAIAFAAQDAISNFFGSLTVMLDRPFEVGDWVKTDGLEGTVETVGFRSTRIRTFHNSLITLPNSRLTTVPVDNMGRRKYRRYSAQLALQYGTSPHQIEAFCEGIRELIRQYPHTRKDFFEVHLNDFSASSIDILLYCFFECPDWSSELQQRHRLLMDILRLAEALNVEFAFPTQTVHLHNQQPSGAVTDVRDVSLGRQTALDLIANPTWPEDRGSDV